VAPTSGSPALCVGDWVVVEHHGPETLAVVEQLPRTSVLVRAGGTSGSPQLLAANVDTVVIALALDQEVDASLLERFLAATWNSGAEPHVLVTKADLGDETSIAAVEAVARSSGPGVPITVASTRSGQGMDELGALFGPGRTGTLVGRSGAGKSSVINALVGSAELAVAEVRESDGKGRHTTSWRELVALPTGGALIDSPGIRSLALWLDTGGIDATFPDIVELSDQCRFSDCSHASEPDCAVREAIASGALEERRLMSYEKLLAEADVLVGRQRDRPDRR